MAGGFDGLPAPTCCLADLWEYRWLEKLGVRKSKGGHHFVHRHGAVREGDSAEDCAEDIVPVVVLELKAVEWGQGRREKDLYIVVLFFSLNGSRNCSIVGAAFCRDSEVVLRLLRAGRRIPRRKDAWVARAQELHIHGSKARDLCLRERISSVDRLIIVAVCRALRWHWLRW